MRRPWRILSFFICVSVSLDVLAETCKYVDSEGNATYANYPVRNARKVLCFDATPATEPEPQKPAAAVKKAAPKDLDAPRQRGFGRVDRNTQRSRDEGRRQILEDELTDELRLLEQARQSLSADVNARDYGALLRDTRSGSDRTQPLREAVELHQRNIEAIENELKRIR